MVETKKIKWIFKKDMMTLWRHKPRLISLLLFPIIMITLFGYGFGGTVTNIPVVIVSQSNGPVTDATLDALKDNSLYDVTSIISDPNQGREMVLNGQVKAAIVLPPNYDDLNSKTSKNVILDLDSSDEIVSSALIPSTQALFSGISTQLGVLQLQSLNSSRSSAPSSAINLQLSNQTTTQSNPSPGGINYQNIINSIHFQVNKLYGNISYIDFLVPGILASGNCVLLHAWYGRINSWRT